MSSLERERGFLEIDDYTFTDVNQKMRDINCSASTTCLFLLKHKPTNILKMLLMIILYFSK